MGVGVGSSHPVPSLPLRGKILAPGGSLLVSGGGGCKKTWLEILQE